MACLIKSVLTGEIIGYEEYSDAKRKEINSNGDYECIPFYDRETCKRVIENLAKKD